MTLLVLMIVVVLASRNDEDGAIGAELDENVVVKIEEDSPQTNKKGTSKFIGVHFDVSHGKWRALRWSKNLKRLVQNGHYCDEESAAHASDTLARNLMKKEENGHQLNFPDDEMEVYPEENAFSSKFIGVTYNKTNANWRAGRRSKGEKKGIYNGSYDDETTAAHASDTLARKFINNGERGHKLNFSDDETDVWAEVKIPTSKHFGVCHNKKSSKWRASRWSKAEQKFVYRGQYDDEKTAAQVSDTLARELMKNGQQSLKLNFSDDDSEVYPVEEKKIQSSHFIGVVYDKNSKKWCALRWSKFKNKNVSNGCYNDEERAAHASDTLARKLMKQGAKNHEFNFPNDDTEVFPEERKTSSKYFGVGYNKQTLRWRAERWSKSEHRKMPCGFYKTEEAAAYASDTLARRLIANGEQNHQLNFPYDTNMGDSEDLISVRIEEDKCIKKKGTSEYFGVYRYYDKSNPFPKWRAARRSKVENKIYSNGSYDNELTAAYASDTLARKFMKNREVGHKLNFSDDETEVWSKQKKAISEYIGLTYNQRYSKWRVTRWSKNEKKEVFNGSYDDEETAAHASDTLAKKLMKNGEKGHKLNFLDDDTEVLVQKKPFGSKFIGVYFHKTNAKWRAIRDSKIELKRVDNGCYDEEETAAHASDTLARELMAKGEKSHKLNFPDNETEVWAEHQKRKRKRYDNLKPQNN